MKIILKLQRLHLNSNNVINKRSNKLKIFFDKNSLELKGWETKDAYSNNVIFTIIDLKTNKVMKNQFFTIPKEEDL